MGKDAKHRNRNIMNNEVTTKLQNGGPYKIPPKMWDITDDPKEKHKAEYEWLTKTKDEQFDILEAISNTCINGLV
jgi:hypothetical protein